MSQSSLILAALAKAATPNLNFTQVRSLSGHGAGDFDTALLTARTGEHYVIRVANNQSAGAEQEVELRSLKALTEAERSALPFRVTNLVGETKDDRGNRALVFEFVYGNPTDISLVTGDSTLSKSIGRAIAAIHKIKPEIVEDAHLASFDPTELVRSRVAELDRFAATGKIPAALLSRWEAALENVSIFRFEPRVIHGNLNADTVLNLDDEVSGVLSWSGLRVSDPAEDFAWILSAGLHELSESILDTYRQVINRVDESLLVRATIYSEFEIARWLMHGLAKDNSEIIADAVSMLEVLADDVATGAVGRLASTQWLAEPNSFGNQIGKSDSELF